MSIATRFRFPNSKSSSLIKKLGIGFCQKRFNRVLTCEEQDLVNDDIESIKNRKFVALWGNGDYGRLGLGSLESKWRPTFVSSFGDGSLREIACGGAHTLFLTDTGTVYASGLNDCGQLGVADGRGYTIDFISSSQVRNRYWAKSYPLWMKFPEANPGPAHTALASLEKANRISFMITQNIDRLHHLAGSNPLELHGTVHFVTCLDCGFSFLRESFQDIVRLLNPKWAAAIESLDSGSNPDQSFGMKRRPNGDIEVDESFWDDLNVPTWSKCNGVLMPDVVFFGDNIPMDKVDMVMDAAEGCDALLVLGSSLETMLPIYLVRVAHQAGASIAIINIGKTPVDEFVNLKIDARLGEILPQLLKTDLLSVPAI